MKKGKSSRSWREKLEKEMRPKIVDVPDKWAEKIGHGKMLVPSPLLIDETIRKIPKGRLATVNILRDRLANTFHADMTCPLTTGIFLNIAANTAEEDKLKGKKQITPYWRVLKTNSTLNAKLPGGTELQSSYLQTEGFEIIKQKRSNNLIVKDFEKKLI
jgi:hypothetical protein